MFVLLFGAVICSLSPVVDMSVHGDHGSGAAKRRRDRRLRMRWRHEQLTLQMALAAAIHHSRDVGPRARGWVRSALHGEDREAPTSQEPGTQHFFLDDDSVPELGGTRPDRLFEVRPQERDQRHTVDQIVDAVPGLPTLDVPVPLMVEQLVDVLQFFDARRAQDHHRAHPAANRGSRAAAGGAAGGSADDRIIFLVAADYGADRGHSSSAGWRVTRRSSRFSPRTEFNRCRADR